MPRIVINIGDSYTDDLKRRLAKHGISHGELARETGIATTQISRMFNQKMQPRMDTVVKLERAILDILRRRKRSNGR